MIIANQWYNIAKTGSVGSKTSVRIELGTYYALIAVSVDYGNAVISAIESNATGNKITIAARIRYNNGWMVDVKVTPGMADAELQTSLYDNSGWISVPAITSTPGSTVCIINDISSAIQFPQAGGESLFERINVGTEDKPVYAVVPKRYNDTPVGIVSETFITFGGLKGANGNNGNQGAGLTKINVVINDISYTSDGNTVTVTEKLAKQSDLQTLTSKVSELEKKVSEFSSLWTYDKVNDAVRTTFNVIIEKALTFGIGDGDISGEGGSGPGVTSLYALPEIGINKSSLSDGQVMTYDKASGLWVNKLPSIGLDEVKLAQYLTANSYLDKKSADGLYTTLTAFNALDTKVNDFLAGTDTDEIINKWKELEAFLAGQTETSTLAELLFVKADKTALKATNKALEDYRSKTDARLDSLEKMWFFDPDHADTIRTVYNIAVEKAITFGGYGESDNTGGGITSVTKEMVIGALGYTPYDSANPKGYITNAALSGYATQSWVQQQGFLTKHQDISHLLSKTEAATTYATITVLGELQSSHNALKAEFNALSTLINVDATEYIDTWNEVRDFLDGYSDSSDLASILSGINADIAKRALQTELGSAVKRLSIVEGYFTDGAANKSIADGKGNNIVNTYATQVALKGVEDKVAELQKMWFFDPDHADTIRTVYNIAVEKAITFGGYGESDNTGGGITSVTKEMVIGALGYTPYDSANPKGYITNAALSGYATQSWVTNQKYLTSVPSEYITETELIVKGYATKGTTLSHYGITDAYTKTQVDNKLTNYLTTNTAQTVLASGAKIFKGSYGSNIYIGGTKDGVYIDVNRTAGGWASGYLIRNIADETGTYAEFGAAGNVASGLANAYIAVGTQGSADAIFKLTSGNLSIAGTAFFSGLTSHEVGLKIGTINVTEKSQNSSKYIEIDGNLVVKGAISFGGFGESSGTGGGITSVTKDMVIDALGYTPYNATNPNGYITSIALNGYATQSWVESKKYLTSITSAMVITALGFTPYKAENFTKVNIKSTLGIYDWALAASKPTYTKSEVGLGNVTNLAASSYLTDLSSNTTNAVSVTVGGTTKSISASILKTSLGLGSLAYKNSLVASDIPGLSWSKITSGKPTTLSGYGITDGVGTEFYSTTLDCNSVKSNWFTHAYQWTNAPTSAIASVIDVTYSADWKTQLWLQHNATPVFKVRSRYNGTTWGDWKTIAYTDSDITGNAASATKLKNSRTLWGQSFNGTDNVTGYLNKVLNPILPSNDVLAVNIESVVASLNYAHIYVSNKTGSADRPLVLQYGYGNVGIGVEQPSYKLDVQGATKISGSNGSGVVIANQGNTIDGYYNGISGNLYLNNYSAGNVYLVTGGGNVGIGTKSPSAKLHVSGNIVITGSITFGTASDRRLKDDIKSMTDKQAVSVLKALNPVTFAWNTTAYELGGLSGKSDGFIADEFEKVIPNSGRDIWNNYRAIDHKRVIAYVVKGWQADHKRSDNHSDDITWLKKKVNELENELNRYRRA